MSVPAFKNSKAKVRRRRSHHGLKPVRIQIDTKTGEAHLPHHLIIEQASVVEKDAPVIEKKDSVKEEEKKGNVVAEKKAPAKKKTTAKKPAKKVVKKTEKEDKE